MIDLIMIQRIQTVYLFLSALFTALLLFLPLAVGVTVSGGSGPGYALGLDRPCLGGLAELRDRPLDRGGLVGARARARSGHDLRVSEPSVAKKTVHRAGRSVARRLRAAGLVPGQLCRSAFRRSLSAASVFPVVSLILTLLAMRGISKDERLVRSLDRIR